MSCTGGVVLGLLPVMLLGILHAGRYLFGSWQVPYAARPDLMFPPVPCPDAMDALSPRSAARKLWKGIDSGTQLVTRSPSELLASLSATSSQPIEPAVFILPVRSHELHLLSNWAHFAAALRPPLRYAVLPLDKDALRAVMAPPGWSLSDFLTANASDLPSEDAIRDEGWLAPAVPILYSPDEASIGTLARLLQLPNATHVDWELPEFHLHTWRHFVQAGLGRGLSELLQWRAISGVLDFVAAVKLQQNGKTEDTPALMLAIGRVDTVPLMNPLPALSTMPAVRTLLD
jgi:hypothetical protein